MIPTAYGGIKFSDIKVSGGFGGNNSPGPSVQPVDLTREDDAPIAVGTRISSRVMPIQFTLTQYDGTGNGGYVANGLDVIAQRMRLLAALQPGNGQERVLVVKTKESGGTELQGMARVGQYRYPNANTVEVDFYLADDRWLERVDTAMPQINLGSASDTPATPLPVGGGVVVKPTIRLGWSQAKSNHEYVRRVTIQNTGTKNWRRVRKTIDLGDTGALVTAGKLSGSGNNLRVRVTGDPSWAEMPRTLTNYNTGRTFCHVFVTIPAGESLSLDFLYGNILSLSDVPQTLDTRTGDDVDSYVADDLEGTSGTATAGAAATLTDGGASWETNRWRYGYIQIVSGTGAGQRRKIVSNTGTVITVARNWSTQPTGTSKYVVWMTGIHVAGGIVTSNGTTTTLTDSSQAWNTDEFKGGALYNITKGIGPFPITGNSATVITISGTMTAPATSDSYYIERSGILNYLVNRGVINTSHRGLWRTSRYFTAGRVWYGNEVPAGWFPYPMLANQDNFAQGRYVDEGSGGGHNDNFWPYLYARRSVRSDNTWPEQGQADGVAYFDPRGISAIDFDYQMKNEGTANVVGSFVLMAQSDAGDRWQQIASDSTARSTLANVTASGMAGYNRLNAEDTPIRVYLGVLPLDGVGVPSKQKKDQSIEVRNHAKMLVYLDLTDWGGLVGGVYGWGSEIEVYNLQATGRIGGGTDAAPPYDAYTANVLLESGQELWINGDPTPGRPLVGVYTASSGALVRTAPRAATITHHEEDIDGNDVATVYRSLKVAPAINLLPLAGIGGYTLTKTTGVTVTDGVINDPAYGWGGSPGKIMLTISATPASAWTIRLTYPAIAVIPDALYEFGFVASRSGLSAGVQTAISVQWGDAGGNFNLADPNQLIQRYMLTAGGLYAGGGGRKVYAGPPDDGSGVSVPGPTTQAIVQLQVIGVTSVTGEIDFLFADLGVPNVYVSESPTGIIGVQSQWREGWYS